MTLVSMVPTRLLAGSARSATAELQRKLGEAQTESTTGRHHDVGLVLGSRIGTDIGLRVELAGIESAIDGSTHASLVAETAQKSLNSIDGLANSFRSMLTGLRLDSAGRTLGATVAHSSLNSLRDFLSPTVDGRFIFSGLTSDRLPLKPYDEGPRDSVVDAFQVEFGFEPTDPAAASVTPEQLTGFLEGAFSDLFSDSDWSNIWSGASADVPKFRLPSGQAFTLSATADAPFARTITRAFTIIEALSQSNLNANAFRAAVDASLVLVSDAQGQIADEQARIGFGEAQLKASQAGMESRRTSIEFAISKFESVDPYEAATRVNALLTQLEGSYTLTGRISRLSLLNYI